MKIESPTEPNIRAHQILKLSVMDAQGKVITEDIEPQSGENCVVYVVDESIKTFLRPDFTDHTKLQFLVNFPQPGKYKVWFEYIYADQPRQISYTLDVK